MTSTCWMIKLLSGAHSGAQMQLDSPAYRVGTTEECDIILSDNQLPDIAFELVIDGEILYLENQAESLTLMCEGQAVGTEAVAIEAFKIYSIGSLQFCFGPAQAKWPALSASQFSETDHQAKQVLTEVTGPVKPGRFSLGRGTQLMVQIAAFLLVTASFMLSNSRYLEAGTVEKSFGTDLSEQLSANDAFSDLDVMRNESIDGEYSWKIKGYVRTGAELELLENQLKSLTLDVQKDIRVMSHIQQSTQALLKQFDMEHLSVLIAEKPGYLSITGVVADVMKWHKVKTLLLSDVAGLIAFNDYVDSKANRVAILQQWIKEEKLQDDILVNGENGRISITSNNSIEKSEPWRRIAARFKARFGTELTLTELSVARPSIDIQSVSQGTYPYLILKNGRRYSIGSHISDGYFLESIEENFVLLKREDEFLKYHVGSI